MLRQVNLQMNLKGIGVLKILRDFASNVGIAFHTPEEYFLREQPVPFTRSFEPHAILNGSSSTSTYASTLIIPTWGSGAH